MADRKGGREPRNATDCRKPRCCYLHRDNEQSKWTPKLKPIPGPRHEPTILGKQTPMRAERFEIFTAVTMKYGVFWNITQCGSCKIRRFGGTQCLHHQGDKNQRARTNVSSNKPPTHAAKENAIQSSETSVLTRAIRRNFQEDSILHRAVKTSNLIWHNSFLWLWTNMNI
jgi:hypothetical protein